MTERQSGVMTGALPRCRKCSKLVDATWLRARADLRGFGADFLFGCSIFLDAFNARTARRGSTLTCGVACGAQRAGLTRLDWVDETKCGIGVKRFQRANGEVRICGCRVAHANHIRDY